MEETKDTTSKEGGLTGWAARARRKIDFLSSRFNTLPLRTRQVSIIFFGMSIAMLCVALVVKSIQTEVTGDISVDKITLPKDTYMNRTDADQELIPVGKLKGEINGEFESFYLAVDGEGQMYVHRDPTFGAKRFVKSEGWESITRKELEVYERELHFIPHRDRGLKPSR